MASLFQLKAYITHWFTVVDQHSVHSPFFFDFYNKVVRHSSTPDQFKEIEKMRSHILKQQTELKIENWGAGSKSLNGVIQKMSDIARISVTPPAYAQFYSRIIRYMEAKNIVELGTSLGLTTLYLARANDAQVTTFEGSHALVNVALTNFEYFDQKNIHLVEGDLKSTLPEFLQNPAKINFILMDANHRYGSTIQYFDWIMKRLDEKSVVVIDDIHWSPEMEKAWNELRRHPLVYGSVDLFRCGILFFEPGLNHQHFVWGL